MPLELQPVTKEQVADVVRITADTMQSNPFRKILFPNGMTEVSRTSLRDRLTESFDKPDHHFMQIWDTDANVMAAACLWIYTKEMTDKDWDAEVEERMSTYPDANQDAMRPFLEGIAAAKRRIKGNERWWELELLTVQPQYQRKGLGARLMEWGEAILEGRKLQSVIVSTPPGYGLYTKHGYQVQERVDVDLNKYGGQGIYFNAVLTRFPKID